MNTKVEKTPAKFQVKDIALFVTWGKISKEYFGKSSSWLYNKLNGVDGNGGVGEFSESEKETFKNALYDLSDRIRETADHFK